MKNCMIAIVAVSGLAAAANAQVATFSWIIDDASLDVGETATCRLMVAMDPDTDQGLAGSIFNIDGGAALGSLRGAGQASVAYSAAFNLGGAAVGNANGWTVDIRQFASAFNGNFDFSNPVQVATVQVTNDGSFAGLMSLTTNGWTGAVGPVDVYLDSFGTQRGYEGASEKGRIQFVPTPASAALLGLAGLTATRRRR